VNSGFLALAGVVDRPDFDKGIEFCPQFYSFACSLMLSENFLPRALQRMQQMLRSTGVYALQLYDLQSHLAPPVASRLGWVRHAHPCHRATRAAGSRPRERIHTFFRLPEHKPSPFNIFLLIGSFLFDKAYFLLIITSYCQVATAGRTAGVTGSFYSEPLNRGTAPKALTCRPCVTPQLPTGR
jgi:hypothetical protein